LAPPRAAGASICAAFEASGRQGCHVVALDAQPIKFELVLTLKTDKALGPTFLVTQIAWVDEVIE
jgi:hypothetical protein